MFDVAIVGAGSAGCVLAHRLSSETSRKVVLIEAGPPKHHGLNVRAPGMYITLWRSKLDWNFTTVPQQHVDNRQMYWPRGRVVGGSNSFNTLVYIRGHRDNYDEWQRLGNPGWGFDDVLPYFKRSEDNARGASEFHGAGGLLPVHDAEPSPIARAFVDAVAARAHVPINADFNGASQDGAGFYQVSVRHGLRASTATHFLDPAGSRDNLTVVTDALALGVALDGDRCTGVRVRVRGRDETIAAREVILCGGAIGSPHLLMLSGIGASAELKAAGVEPRHELPGVGKHLEDHLLCYMVHRAKATTKLSRAGLLWSVMKHVAGRSGMLAKSPVEAGAFLRHAPDAPRPDEQIHFVPYGIRPPNSDIHGDPYWGRWATIMPGLIYPRSHGEITLKSADPAEAPLIDPNYFSAPADLEHLVTGAKLCREIAATAPLAEHLEGEHFPGDGVKTDDELRAWARLNVNTIFHPTGTCKMGPAGDPMAVVDPELRVHGLRGLRVADASIMPRIIGGNTNAPTIMIAEKAADLARG
jgi:choline dehydrogenase